MLRAGDLNRRVTIERAVVTDDDHGGEVDAWSALGRRWAQINYGSGSERRQAAQLAGSQAATVRVRSDSLTRTLALTDRLHFDDAAWNIVALAPWGRREAIDISAVRAA